MIKVQIPNDWLLILFEIWILRFGNYLQFGACNLLFPDYQGFVPLSLFFAAIRVGY